MRDMTKRRLTVAAILGSLLIAFNGSPHHGPRHHDLRLAFAEERDRALSDKRDAEAERGAHAFLLHALREIAKTTIDR